MKTIKFEITGTLPLVVHNGQLANPLNPFAKQLKAITKKKPRTDADIEQMAKLEFMGGLYVHEELGVYMPADAWNACIVGASKKSKRGKDAQAAIYCSDMKLIFDGPQSPEDMWRDESFRFVRGVKVGQARIMRTRPIFQKWAGLLSVEYDDQILNESDVIDFVKLAGEVVGLCEWRPRYGRFKARAV